MVKSSNVFPRRVARNMARGYLGETTTLDDILPEGITEREAEVLQLVSEGASNPEIAQRLHVSVSNVQYHLTNVYGKLGVRSRAEAIVQAARSGLIVIDD